MDITDKILIATTDDNGGAKLTSISLAEFFASEDVINAIGGIVSDLSRL